MLRAVKVVPNPPERSPKTSLRPPLGVVVDGHFHDFVELVVQCRNLCGVVVSLGVGHALHQWLGGVDRFFVRPNDRRFQVDAARLKRDIDDLRDPALD